MPVTPVASELLAAQVDKITSSNVLKGSEALCRLLRYLADYSLAHPGGSLKEYQVATELFGRPETFDPRLDSTVRVQTGRLRNKLAEYYAGEGHNDRVVLEVPRGSYSLAIAEAHEPPAPVDVVEPVLLNERHPRPALIWLLALITVGSLSSAITLWMHNPAKTRAAAGTPRVFLQLWSRFTDVQDRPLVVFSNAEFVGHPTTALRYFDPARDSRATIVDSYTGVGEVLAIHELDRLFASLNHGLRLKRSRLLSFDDAKNSDLIFVGSPAENLPLRELPMTREFVFRRIEGGAQAGNIEIANVHPEADEPGSFVASNGIPPRDDYAVIGLVPGLAQGRSVMILAGTTTVGTQAAVEFVCREDQLRELTAKLEDTDSERVRPFEAVIKVKISGGVGVASELVAVRAR